MLGLVGSLTSRKFALAPGTQLVGRDASQCQIVLEQAVVSRRHAEIDVDEHGRVTLTDLAARHATFVNDVAITRRELQDGDRIGFGPSGVVAFSFHAAAALARTVHGAPPAGQSNDRAADLRAKFAAAAQTGFGSDARAAHRLSPPRHTRPSPRPVAHRPPLQIPASRC